MILNTVNYLKVLLRRQVRSDLVKQLLQSFCLGKFTQQLIRR